MTPENQLSALEKPSIKLTLQERRRRIGSQNQKGKVKALEAGLAKWDMINGPDPCSYITTLRAEREE
jgi:hypothetical protein